MRTIPLEVNELELRARLLSAILISASIGASGWLLINLAGVAWSRLFPWDALVVLAKLTKRVGAGSDLSEREFVVLCLIVAGRSNKGDWCGAVYYGRHHKSARQQHFEQAGHWRSYASRNNYVTAQHRTLSD